MKALQSSGKGTYMVVDTRPFMDNSAPRRDMVSPKAYMYVPNQCFKGGCHLHVHLHGCTEAEGDNFELLMQDDGFMMYAAANRVVVLYPSLMDDAGAQYFNPNTWLQEKCWHVDQKIPASQDWQTLYIMRLIAELQK